MKSNKFVLTTIIAAGILACYYGSRIQNANAQETRPRVAMETPIGTIIAWPGPVATLPTGWRLCNGDQLPKSQYPDLFNVLQDYWGPLGTQPDTTFHLPDLRGVLLRGVTMARSDAYSDPDVAARAQQKPGTTNDVGSLQGDLLKSHTHLIPKGFAESSHSWKAGGHDEGTFVVAPNPKQTTDSVGGNETRPKNAYVHYIIRALSQSEAERLQPQHP